MIESKNNDEALFLEALEETHREYGGVLKKLAECDSADERRRAKFQQATANANRKFGKALKKLAE